MKISLFPTLKNYKKEYFGKDLTAGIMIAAVSIPISMGYAEVSGLPAVFGLYGSVLPILFFALFSTSPQFIFGVDAAPAAIAGAALASLGIESGSVGALRYIPVIALFVGLWLLLFYFLKAGKLVTFISTPVMGGFISGIALTIILMQIPKIMGGKSGSGELPELLKHLYETALHINWVSVGLGVGALAILIISKKVMPKFPMAVVIMALGMVSTLVFHVDHYGVALLSKVEPGLPKFIIPSVFHVDLKHAAGRGLMIAVVVMAETLLSENNFASKNGYKIDDNKEILACAAGNIISAFTGSVMGVILSTTTLLAQKMVPAEMVGQASSLVVLGRTLGQAMMTGILGLAFSLGINAGLSKFPEVSFKNVNEFISTASNVVVPEKIHGQLEQIVLGALHNVFFLALLLCVVTFVVNLFDDGKLRA